MKDDEYYWEEGRFVFTERYHERRGRCCGSGCRHCPYGHRDVDPARKAGVKPPWRYFGPGTAPPEEETVE